MKVKGPKNYADYEKQDLKKLVKNSETNPFKRADVDTNGDGRLTKSELRKAIDGLSKRFDNFDPSFTKKDEDLLNGLNALDYRFKKIAGKKSPKSITQSELPAYYKKLTAEANQIRRADNRQNRLIREGKIPQPIIYEE